MTLQIMTHLNKKRYAPGGAGEDLYYLVLQKIRPLMQQGGKIRTADAWHATGIPYSICATAFANIMDEMVQQGLATKEGKGRYFVNQPDIPFEPAKPEAQKPKTIYHSRERVGAWYSQVYGCWMTTDMHDKK